MEAAGFAVVEVVDFGLAAGVVVVCVCEKAGIASAKTVVEQRKSLVMRIAVRPPG